MTRNRGRAQIVVAVVLLALVLCLGVATAALAQRDPYSNDGPEVRPDLITRDVDPVPPAEPPTVLPFTGGDVTTFVLLGIGAIGMGTVIVRHTRRSRNEA